MDDDALEQAAHRERIGIHEIFRLGPCFHVHDIKTTAAPCAVILELRPASQQQGLVFLQEIQVLVAQSLAQGLGMRLVKRFDQIGHKASLVDGKCGPAARRAGRPRA